MGQSTNAILFYGFLFEEEDEFPEFMSDFDDFEEYCSDKVGFPNYGEAGYDYEKRREFLKTLPVEFITHCSGDYPMYGLAIKGTVFQANSGYATTFDDGIPEISTQAIDKFRVWCIDNEIEKNSMGWQLCSYWG